MLVAGSRLQNNNFKDAGIRVFLQAHIFAVICLNTKTEFLRGNPIKSMFFFVIQNIFLASTSHQNDLEKD